MSYVTTGARKKDAMSLVTGKPVYTGDQVPAGALRLKLLRSPHVPSMCPRQNWCRGWCAC